MDKHTIKKAFVATIPVLTGYIPLGMGFGILLESNGYGISWAFFMSLFIFAGVMQYVAVELLASGAGLITVAITTFLVNARHLFYGVSLIEKYKGMGLKKLYMMFALTDETYTLVALGYPDERVNLNWYYFLISIFNHIYWIIGGILGCAISSLIDFNSSGIDFVLTALFIVIFLEHWLKGDHRTSSLIGIISSAICLLIFGSENFMIPAMIVIATLLTIFKRRLKHDK